MDCRMLLLLGIIAAGSAGTGLAAMIRDEDDRRRPERPEPPARLALRSDLDVLFRPGSEFVLSDGGRATTDVHRADRLHLPAGRLIAADPSWLPSWQRLGIGPYTTTVPAGTWVVGDQSTGEQPRTWATCCQATVTIRYGKVRWVRA